MSASEESAAALARAVRDGAAGALGSWYEHEWPVVYRLAFGLLAEANAAEDLAQDAMLHLSDRLDRWDAQRSYTAWRNRVVLNLGRDRLRRRDARRAAERQAADLAPGPLPDPTDPTRSDEIRAALCTALRSLPDREREAFVLIDLEGVDASSAASAMGVGRSTVRSLVSLARRRLRDLLAPRLFPSALGGSDG